MLDIYGKPKEVNSNLNKDLSFVTYHIARN